MKLTKISFIMAFAMMAVFCLMLFVLPARTWFSTTVSYVWTMVGILASCTIFILVGFWETFASPKRYFAWLGMIIGLSILGVTLFEGLMTTMGPNEVVVGCFSIILVVGAILTFKNIITIIARSEIKKHAVVVIKESSD